MLKQSLKKVLKFFIRRLYIFPLQKKILKTKKTQTPIKYKTWFIQKIFGFNRNVYWPVHHSSIVSNADKILIGIDTSPGYMPGCYIQGRGGISIGDYTQIACNVGIISENHDFYDSNLHVKSDSFPSVEIGKYCWIGMNVTILPGVKLGDFTVIGSGSVVTKSFRDGKCIIAGNPAKKIKDLDNSKCHEYQSENKFNGYIENSEFDNYRKSKLKI